MQTTRRHLLALLSLLLMLSLVTTACANTARQTGESRTARQIADAIAREAGGLTYTVQQDNRCYRLTFSGYVGFLVFFTDGLDSVPEVVILTGSNQRVFTRKTLADVAMYKAFINTMSTVMGADTDGKTLKQNYGADRGSVLRPQETKYLERWMVDLTGTNGDDFALRLTLHHDFFH